METKRRRLLLADDSLTIQKVVTLTFSDEGMEVVAVGSGDQAIQYLEETGPPDIVLADVNMPGLTGYEVCERIKQDARWRHLPVVLLAGAFEPFNVAEARRVGADEVLSKPFQSIRDLIGKVGSLLGGKSEEAAAHEEPRRAGGDEHARPRATTGSSLDAPAAAAPEAPAEADTPYVRSDSYAGLGVDDEMIEATPAEQFGARAELSQTQPSAHAADDFGGAEDFYGAKAAADSRMSERREAPAYAGAVRDAGVETHAPRAAFAAHAAGAIAADDALLEIGSLELPSAAAEADDFVLDLDLDEPPPTAPTRYAAPASWEAPAPRAQGATASEPDAAGAFAEAAHGDAEPAAPQAYVYATAPSAAPDEPAMREEADAVREEPAVVFEEPSAPRGFVEPQVVASAEPVGLGEDLSIEGDIARPPAGDAAGVSAAAAAAPVSSEQLSPEVIDRIARRVVELMSERVVQEVAWEVVPALAERMIRQRLDEQK